MQTQSAEWAENRSTPHGSAVASPAISTHGKVFACLKISNASEVFACGQMSSMSHVRFALNFIELHWIELNWFVNWFELNWIELKHVEMKTNWDFHMSFISTCFHFRMFSFPHVFISICFDLRMFSFPYVFTRERDASSCRCRDWSWCSAMLRHVHTRSQRTGATMQFNVFVALFVWTCRNAQIRCGTPAAHDCNSQQVDPWTVPARRLQKNMFP